MSAVKPARNPELARPGFASPGHRVGLRGRLDLRSPGLWHRYAGEVAGGAATRESHFAAPPSGVDPSDPHAECESEGKPDAVAPHVRFEERDVETEQGGAIEAPANERAGNR